MKKQLLCSLCCAALLMGAAAPAAPAAKSVLTASAAEESVYASLNNTTVQPGVPLTVTLTGGTAESYRWTVDGKTVSETNSYTPSENDYEKMISVTVTADGQSYTASAYCSILPVVYISTDEEITSKTEYIDGTCVIQGNADYTDETQLYSGAMKIRGRGNYTWVHDKKPYKIKLDTKTDVLGMRCSCSGF